MWKLKQKSNTLKKSKIILYESVFLEAFNIPILFVPIFYHPDPSVRVKQAFLLQKFLAQILLGQFMNTHFFNFSNTSNLITKARLSSKEGLLIINDHNAFLIKVI